MGLNQSRRRSGVAPLGMKQLMAAVIPRHVLCILGNWRDLDGVETIVGRVGGSGFQLDRNFSHLTPDPRMVQAFQASYDRVQPSMTDEDWQAIGEHSAVAYVLSPPLLKRQAQEISGQTLLLTAALLQEGGLAAKGKAPGSPTAGHAGSNLVPGTPRQGRLRTTMPGRQRCPRHGSDGRSWTIRRRSCIHAACTSWENQTRRLNRPSPLMRLSNGSTCLAFTWSPTSPSAQSRRGKAFASANLAPGGSCGSGHACATKSMSSFTILTATFASFLRNGIDSTTPLKFPPTRGAAPGPQPG